MRYAVVIEKAGGRKLFGLRARPAGLRCDRADGDGRRPRDPRSHSFSSQRIARDGLPVPEPTSIADYVEAGQLGRRPELMCSSNLIVTNTPRLRVSRVLNDAVENGPTREARCGPRAVDCQRWVLPRQHSECERLPALAFAPLSRPLAPQLSRLMIKPPNLRVNRRSVSAFPASWLRAYRRRFARPRNRETIYGSTGSTNHGA